MKSFHICFCTLLAVSAGVVQAESCLSAFAIPQGTIAVQSQAVAASHQNQAFQTLAVPVSTLAVPQVSVQQLAVPQVAVQQVRSFAIVQRANRQVFARRAPVRSLLFGRSVRSCR